MILENRLTKNNTKFWSNQTVESNKFNGKFDLNPRNKKVNVEETKKEMRTS